MRLDRDGATWITLANTSGVGKGEVRYSVDRNTGAAREGTITIIVPAPASRDREPRAR